MLQALREKSSGWVATVILGILIVPFALFGVNDYMSRGAENYAARIQTPPSWWQSAPAWWPMSVFWDSEEIDLQEFRNRFDLERQAARREQGDAFDNRTFESPENKRRVLESLIDQRIMQMAARDAGIVIPGERIQREIRSIPDFQVEGRFNLERYQSLLAASNPPMSPLQFQERVRADLLTNSLVGTLFRTGFATPGERDRMLKLMFEKRDVTFALVPQLFDNASEVADADIQARYTSHAAEYRAPETVEVEYIEVDASRLEPSVPHDAQLRANYEENRAKYGSAEQRRIAHILVPLEAGADAAARKAAEDKAAALAQQARGGADFAALARANPGDPGSAPQGGDLGWLERNGAMTKPFEDAAFEGEAGSIVGPVRTDFGLHVIRVVEVRPGTVRPFEEVRDELRQEAMAGGRERAYNELLGQLVDELMKNPSGFVEIAARHQLPVQKSGPVPKDAGEGVMAVPAVQREIFSEQRIGDGSVSDPIEVAPERSVLVRVVGHSPEKPLPLAEVRERVIADVRAERASKAAEGIAEELAAAVRKGESLATLAAAKQLHVQPMPGLVRAANLPTPEAARAIFNAPAPSAAAGTGGKIRMPDGAWLVFQVDAVHATDPAEVPEQEKAMLSQQLAAADGDQAARAYIAAMRKRLRIIVAESQL